MGWSSGQLHWNFHFCQSLQDWEEESFDRFMEIVYSSKVRGVCPNKVCWKLANSGGFEVSSFYLSFYPPLSFPWSLVWQSKVPLRVAFISWLASFGKILTTNNLHKRRIVAIDWCYMCKRCGESMDHLLLHCPLTCELQSLVFCLFGLHWVMPLKVIEVFKSWQCKFGRHCNIDLWRLVPHYLMWCIWRERNVRCFEGCEQPLLEIKSFFLYTLLIWSVALSHFSCFSLPLLLDHCNFGS